MAGISSKAQIFGNPENKFEYNGIEFETDLELLTYDAFYRELNPQIGVWLQIDPKIEQNMENWGAYVSNFDNPIKFKDPKGDCPTCEEIWDEFKSAAKETAKSIKENAVAFYIGAGNVARSINEFNPLANLVEVITGKSTSSDFTQPKPRSMSTADLGVNTLMLFGGGAARAFNAESKTFKGVQASSFSESNSIKGLIGPGLKYKENKLIQHAHQWGIGEKGVALTSQQLDLMKKITSHIYKNPIEVRQGAWANPAAGGFDDALYYFNGKHIVVTQSDGTLITILKNASGNKHFNNAKIIWSK